MAQPDNVARVIAACAALGAALNMAVGYANYRRKRPRLSLRRSSYVGWQCDDPGGDRGGPFFHLHMRNSGETPVRVMAVHIDFGPALTHWWQRLRYRATRGRSWQLSYRRRLDLLQLGGGYRFPWNDPYYNLPVPEDGSITLAAFDQADAMYLLRADGIWRGMGRDDRARLTVELPGGQCLHGTLHVPEYLTYYEDEVDVPESRDQQMTFDDLMEAD